MHLGLVKTQDLFLKLAAKPSGSSGGHVFFRNPSQIS